MRAWGRYGLPAIRHQTPGGIRHWHVEFREEGETLMLLADKESRWVDVSRHLI